LQTDEKDNTAPRLNFLTRFGRSLLVPIMPTLRELDWSGKSSDLDPEIINTFFGVVGSAVILIALALVAIVLGGDISWVFWVAGVLLTLGVLAGTVAIFSLRVATRVKSRIVADVKQARANDPNFRNVEAVLADRQAAEKSLFERNLKDEFCVSGFRWQNVLLFEDGEYNFAPRVNVLLGRNGLGKTLLLRTLVAMLQHDAQYSALLFPTEQQAERPPQLRLAVQRNGKSEQALRDSTYFTSPAGQSLVGKIPVLAIPDSRFLDRTRTTVTGAAQNAEGLASGGAHNFLTQEPFGNIIEDFLTGLCLDYGPRRLRNPRRRFDRGIFKLVEDVVAELAENRAFQFAEINRIDRSRFEILVRTTDHQDLKMPIQAASQGTLSVIAIFGLIYSFLHALHPDETGDNIRLVPAIVIIDEIDAHLHPSWQQKILRLLTNRFPNVQFIVSAHSPLIVAGCDEGEVSVLRRREDTGRLYVYPPPGDFIGAKAADLYERIFDIEEKDRTYLEYSTKTAKDLEAAKAKLSQLVDQRDLSLEQEGKLADLLREQRLITRTEEVRKERLEDKRANARLEKTAAELDRLRYQLMEREREAAELQAELAQLKARGEGKIQEGSDDRPK
jgi:hypothetical protein